MTVIFLNNKKFHYANIYPIFLNIDKKNKPIIKSKFNIKLLEMYVTSVYNPFVGVITKCFLVKDLINLKVRRDRTIPSNLTIKKTFLKKK